MKSENLFDTKDLQMKGHWKFYGLTHYNQLQIVLQGKIFYIVRIKCKQLSLLCGNMKALV